MTCFVNLFLYLLINCVPIFQVEADRVEPEEIIQKMMQIYASLNSYTDEGVVNTYLRQDGQIALSQIKFKTIFLRPNRLRFELNYCLENGTRADQEILLSDGERVFISEKKKPVPIKSIEEGLASLDGISFGSSYFVPRMLLGLKEKFLLSNLRSVRIEGEEKIDNEDFVLIRGKHPKRESDVLIYIKKKDFILVKIRYIYENKIIEETHYNIKINAEVSAELFKIPSLR